jgi:hypothetical protein
MTQHDTASMALCIRVLAEKSGARIPPLTAVIKYWKRVTCPELGPKQSSTVQVTMTATPLTASASIRPATITLHVGPGKIDGKGPQMPHSMRKLNFTLAHTHPILPRVSVLRLLVADLYHW